MVSSVLVVLFVLPMACLVVRFAVRRTAAVAEYDHAPRSVVVTGSYGSGHDVAAARIADVLRRAGKEVVVVDVVDTYPAGMGRILRRLYFAQLSSCPRTWQWLLSALTTRSWFGAHALLVIRHLLAVLPAARLRRRLGTPDLVVSTHPFASAALARMRLTGALDAPVASYLTDPSVHALWVHPGIEHHLALYPEAARQARELGAAGVRLIQPLASTTSKRRDAPVRDRVPSRLPAALVVGGSEGVGDLLGTARDLARSGLVTPVVVCGRNRGLLDQVRTMPDAIGLPWCEDLDVLMGSAAVVVQNAGGSTALEALSMGTPVISYRCIPGHGVTNAEALARDGLAPWVATPAALIDALTDALVSPGAFPVGWEERPSLVEVLCGDPVSGAPTLTRAGKPELVW